MMLSYVIPCYNSAQTVHLTLQSIFSQQVNFEFEVIVVDNNSDDHTLEVLKTFPVTIYTEHKRGPNFARNLGIEHAKGIYIAFVDSDVQLDPHWSQELIDYITRKNLMAATGPIVRVPFKEKKSLLEEYRCNRPDHPAKWISLVTPEFKVGFINTAACIYKTSTLKSVNNFSKTLKRHEDVDLYLKIQSLPSGSVGATRKALAYCVYPHSILSYMKRYFIHGYYYAFVSYKWKHKKRIYAVSNWNKLSLQIVEFSLISFMRAGRLIGSFVLTFSNDKNFTEECLFLKKINSIPKLKKIAVYFEDTELTL